MSRIRVLIVDDHALVRAGLRALLTAHPDFEVAGEVSDGVVVEQCRRAKPDVVLMDLSMPGRDGLAAIRDLRHSCPTVRILVLTMRGETSVVRQALLAGASGYVLKSSSSDELLGALRAVHQGRQYITPALANALTESAPAEAPAPARRRHETELTPREREVASLLALGHTNLETAARLHITVKTVETHRKRLTAKLGFRSRADLVRFALESKLIDS
ncbi:MAG: response regulator transcription factor [Verrucomicrobia bacterium]|nr:response regulator transcription factor [Verrucomicrobiota bacterium]